MSKKPPGPVPITLGKFTNPKNSEDDWRKWREEQLQKERNAEFRKTWDFSRRKPVRYDEDET